MFKELPSGGLIFLIMLDAPEVAVLPKLLQNVWTAHPQACDGDPTGHFRRHFAAVAEDSIIVPYRPGPLFAEWQPVAYTHCVR